jgi:type II secretory pathway component GspD/PulD (secretin)
MGRRMTRQNRDIPSAPNRVNTQKTDEASLPVRIYHLNYVKADDAIMLIKPLIGSKGTITKSEADRKSLDKESFIIVQDTENTLKTIDRMIAEYDVQPKQVLIEAAIIEVTLNKDEKMGDFLAKLVKQKNGPADSGKETSPSSASDVVPASFLSPLGNGIGINKPNFAAGKGASIGAHDDNSPKIGWYDGIPTQELSAMEGVKVLCCPRILVLNKQRAEIHLGKNLGYQDQTTTETSTTSTTNFLKVGTQLRLRPVVTPDGMVRMEVQLERSDGDLDDKGIPQTTVQSLTANVMIPDGRTMVLIDLLSYKDSQSEEYLPMMNQLSWAESVFPYLVDPSPKKELVLFLTAHILRNP